MNQKNDSNLEVEVKTNSDWKCVRLGDYVVSVKGKRPKRLSKARTEQCSIPYINIKAFEEGIIEEYTDGVGCSMCNEGDFLMVWDGSRSGYVGKAIYGAIGSTLVKLDFPGIYKQYAFYFFQSKFIEINTRAKGVGIPHVDPSLLWNYDLLIPPLSTQKEVVAKLDTLFAELDRAVAHLEAAREKLKTYRQAVLKWAFEGRLTNKHVKDGELPEGWRWVKLGDVSNIIGGVTKGKDFKGKKTISLPYLRVANVQNGYLDLGEVKHIEVLPDDKVKYKLKRGDVLYTEGGDKDKLGRGTIWQDEIPDCIHQNHVFRARPKPEEVDSKFLAFFSQSLLARRYFYDNAKQTTNLASINLTILANLPIPIPDIEAQREIVRELHTQLAELDNQTKVIDRNLDAIQLVRQSTLTKAFSGQLL